MNQSQEKTQTNTTPKIAFIQACWHRDIVDVCRESFCDEIRNQNIESHAVEVFDVPGSFETPLLAKKLAQTGQYAAIVAAGLVVDGGIYRHDFVASAVIDGLMRVQMDCDTPVISAVLTPHHFHETDDHKAFYKSHFVKKGQEAALACAMTIGNLRKLSTAA